MNAQLKCSNCGAEITNLTMSWGQKYWLWFIPFAVFIIFIPYFTDFMFKDTNDFREDLSVSGIERRYVNGTIEILGVVQNAGQVNWQHITIEAELFSKDGKFLDEITGRNEANLSPGASERFKIHAQNFPRSRWDAIGDVKVKVADAYHSRF